MKKTLEEILKDSESGNVREVISYLTSALKTQDRDNVIEVKKTFDNIVSSQEEIKVILTQILEKPEREFPEQKEFPILQKVSGEIKIQNMPDIEAIYETWNKTLLASLRSLILSIVETIKEEGEKTRNVMSEMDTSEDIQEQKESTTVNTGSVRSRRTTQWKIATYPQITGTVALVSSGDGKTFYLPNGVIPNSETIRLNQGIPLSHGVDYTISGNKIVYILDQSVSQHEIRYQTR